MKKLLLVLLAIALCVMAAGCGNDNANQPAPTDAPLASEQPVETPLTEGAAQTEASPEAQDPADGIVELTPTPAA